ncbi:MAG TPA: ABC transporter ATP-binding protein [Candidatus Dormibacteraeota bacterium]|jgi:ABC-2 type transport system ATP-binding protein
MTVAKTTPVSPAIEIKAVSKRFPRSQAPRWAQVGRKREADKVALDAVSLTVGDGEITAILGPNGSGKSTLVRVLSTLLTPDGGSAEVFGHDVVRESMTVRRHINRVSVEAAFFKEMSPWENLCYAARLYGVPRAGMRDTVEKVIARLGLGADTLDKPMKQLSRGQQQKVAIARAFLTSPSLLLMDEPTTGLDPRSKREVQDLIGTIREERDATVLLCTHDLQEAEALADRVLIIDRGQILADGTAAELRKRHGKRGEKTTLEDVFMRLTGKRLDDDSENDDDEKERKTK